jgi:hypothetical protein
MGALKERFTKLTGSTIETFLSSDGQSIPFGRNWVHEIEVALERCEIMFVFVTPRSVSSPWLFFEAGYAYSRKVQVVPVAFLGADLASAPGPLARLQGFNAKNAGGLNNLVATVNRRLTFTHVEGFSDADFDRITGLSPDLVSGELGRYAATLDDVRITMRLHGESGFVDLVDVERRAQADKYVAVADADSVYLDGATLRRLAPQAAEALAEVSVPAILKAFHLARYVLPNDTLQVRFWFAESVSCEENSHKVTGRLATEGVTVVGPGFLDYRHSVVPQLEWQGVRFSIGMDSRSTKWTRALVVFEVPKGHLDLNLAGRVITMLFERAILAVRE